MNRADDELLERLGVALAATPAAPTRDEIDAVRALATGGGGARVAPWRSARDAQHPLRHVLVAAALVVGLVMAGGLVALSAGAPVPTALRAPARALGLPVDSAALAEARSAVSALRVALAGPDDARVAAAAVSLETALGRLDAGDRAVIETEARLLLAQAADRLGVVPDADPVLRDLVTTPPPASTGDAGITTGTAGSEAPVGPSAGTQAGDPPPSSAASPELESEAPETGGEGHGAPETEAPEGSGSSID